jgi:ketosteroid isomerase-like protein
MSESNLEDRASIHDLFTRYCCALDNGEVEAVVDCFTADAILKSPVIDISGRDEIRAFAGALRRNAPRARNFVMWSAISP